MILHFRRLADGAIITRELGEAAGARARLSAPAGAELLAPDVAGVELDRLAADRRGRRAADAAAFAEARRGAYGELLALGLSAQAASALSGHRPGGAGA